MRSRTLAAAVVLTCAAAVSSVGAASAAQAPATAGSLCTTAQTIEITSLFFNPPAVHAGGTSVASASLHNCTAQSQSAGAEWYGRFVSSTGTGFPAGCPVIDPIILPVNLPPFSFATASLAYTVPAGCTANGLIVTVTILQNGKAVAQRSAELIID